MKDLALVIVILVAASTSALAQSGGGEIRISGCKSGNLLQERDPSVVEEMGCFIGELKTAIAKGDKRRVARLVHYPLSFATADAELTIHSEQEFVKKYNRVLPPQLRDLLLRQETRCISRVGAKGFTIGTGEIWFDRFQDGKVKIFTVTAVVFPDE
jgi:hypothetical protein